ncbi:MAG: hypothetical protein KF878_00840 [Planctomycetes bacterium]|nr:hypothetical protein [Planctomycetota bacterium]
MLVQPLPSGSQAEGGERHERWSGILHRQLPFLQSRLAPDFRVLIVRTADALAKGNGDRILGSALITGLETDPENVHADLSPMASYLSQRPLSAQPPGAALEYWQRDFTAEGERGRIYLVGDLELMLIKLRMQYGCS